LATACLGHDESKAIELFAMLAARYGSREAWTGLAISRRNSGDLAGALGAVSRALTQSVSDAALASIADTLVRQLGLTGWCEASVDGVLTVHRADPGRQVQVTVDGARQRSTGAEMLRLPGERWHAAHEIAVTADGEHLIGSPIDVRAIRRVEGCVNARDGALEGWVWHPADPLIDPVIRISAQPGKNLTLIARDETGVAACTTLLARPRRFYLPPDRMTGMVGPFHVRGADGQDLLGSPLDPTYEQRVATEVANAQRAAFPASSPRVAPKSTDRPALVSLTSVPADIIGPRPPSAVNRRPREVDVIVPLHGGGTMARSCLESVLATVPSPSRVIVIDDATSEPDLAAYLVVLARGRNVRLVRHSRAVGYPASANAGIAAAAGRDAVLLNSDTLVAPCWLDRLREIAYSAADIGTVSPLSNNGTILSYPRRDKTNAMPDAAETARLATLAHRANHGIAVEVPVAVGLCMYVRRDCLDAVGGFREDVFAQGYGEEDDFCLRARHLGWRHVVAPGVFVAHYGAYSIGPAGAALRARNQVVLNRLHPGHKELIAAHLRRDPLASARRRLDLARWRAVRPAQRVAALLITHNDGGGVERRVASACAAYREAGVRPIVLRPTTLADSSLGAVLSDGVADMFPNLRFALPSELSALARLLRGAGLREVELHHLLGHHAAVLELIGMLGVPYDVHLHDYALICPRITLVGRDRRYCGEPAVATCETCVADLGSVSGEAIGVAALRQRSGRLLAGARHVVAPSEDTAVRLRRHFPATKVQMVPHGDDKALAAGTKSVPPHGDRARICVVGAIGVEKGYDILLAGARDAAERDLPLEFVVVGHTIDDARLLDTGRVFVTGEFRPEEAVDLIRAQDASVAWLPSVWPETWCFALSDVWRAGLHAVAFDLGAQAERIRRSGRGVLLPLGLPPTSINSALLAAAALSRHS
jgi:GT2 family glycosyltransferase